MPPGIALGLTAGAALAYLAAVLAGTPRIDGPWIATVAVNLTALGLLAYVGMAVGREQRRARDDAIRLSTIDPLTGLCNRTYFFTALEREIARGERSGRAFCLVMLDLDDLKFVNDRFGHIAGDQVLRLVGDVVRTGVRKIDVAARYGGDEFVALLPETDPTGGWVLAEKIRLSVAEQGMPRRPPGTTVSVGVVSTRRTAVARAPRARRRGDVRARSAAATGPDARRSRSWTRRSRTRARDRARGLPSPLGGRSRQAGVASAGDRRTTPSRPVHARDPRRLARAARSTQTPTIRPDLPDRDVHLGGRRASSAAVLTGEPPGYAYSRIDNPTVVALGDAFAELDDAEAGYRVRDRHGRDPRRVPASLLRAGDRVLVGQVGYGTTRTQAIAAFGRFGRRRRARRRDRPRRGRGGARGAAHARPPRRDLANPTCVARRPPRARRPRAPPRRRCYVVDNTFASPARVPPARARRRPRHRVRDEVPRRPQRPDGRRRRRVARPDRRGRSAQIDTGATLGPFAAFLVLRGHLTLAVRMDRHAANGDGTRELARASGRRAPRPLPGPPEPPPGTTSPRASSPAGGGDALVRARGRPRRRQGVLSTRSRSPSGPRPSAAVHTMVVHPPSSSHRSLEAELVAAAGITPGLLRVSRRARGRGGPASPTSRPRARRRAGDDPGRGRRVRGLPSPTDRGAPRRPPAPSPVRPPALGIACGACSRRSTSPSSRSSRSPVRGLRA